MAARVALALRHVYSIRQHDEIPFELEAGRPSVDELLDCHACALDAQPCAAREIAKWELDDGVLGRISRRQVMPAQLAKHRLRISRERRRTCVVEVDARHRHEAIPHCAPHTATSSAVRPIPIVIAEADAVRSARESSRPVDDTAPRPRERPYRVETIIFDLERREQIAFLDAALWMPEGAVIELGPPNRDAVVLATRLALPDLTAFGEDEQPVAHLIVDVQDPGSGTEDFIARHPLDRPL